MANLDESSTENDTMSDAAKVAESSEANLVDKKPTVNVKCNDKIESWADEVKKKEE